MINTHYHGVNTHSGSVAGLAEGAPAAGDGPTSPLDWGCGDPSRDLCSASMLVSGGINDLARSATALPICLTQNEDSTKGHLTVHSLSNNIAIYILYKQLSYLLITTGGLQDFALMLPAVSILHQCKTFFCTMMIVWVVFFYHTIYDYYVPMLLTVG